MKKVLYGILVVYIVIAIIVTVGLLSYNEHNLTQLGDKVYIKLKDKIGDYNKGDLLIVRDTDDYVAQDNVFYCKLKNDECVVSYGVIETMMSGTPTIWGEETSRKLVIGVDKDVTVVPVMGSILSVLESRIGYLCIIILPILLAFVYIGRSILKEVKSKK